jgi:hypothetical protein
MGMWSRFWLFWAVATFALWLHQPVKAQIVTVPIPGAPGLSVTVGVGANAQPLQDIRKHPNAVNITTVDDGYTAVPLQFNFSLFGRSFTNSWAGTNGFVTFQDPSGPGGIPYGGCCSGVDLTTTTDPAYNYTIYGLHTDLYSWHTANQWYLPQGNSMTYGWYDMSQCCSSQGGNSFEIKINQSGLVDTRISGALITYNAVTSGVSGDLSQGQYYQYYHGQGINIVPGSGAIFSWQALQGTGQDLCTTNPLSSPTCPGYQQAYTTQQCTINALYDPVCPGYQQAYTTQQCTINALWSPVCPGYQQALILQQQSQQAAVTTTTTSTTTVSVTGTVSTTEPTITIATDGTVTTAVATVPEAEVNAVITRQIPSTASPTGTVTLQVQTRPQEETEEERRRRLRAATADEIALALKEEKKREEEASERRRELAARMRAAAQERALSQGREAIRQADTARTMDEQMMTQASIVAVMAFVPGFESYGLARLPDAPGYRPYEIYRGQTTVDNRRLMRGLTGASDQRHADMVDSQYGKQ